MQPLLNMSHTEMEEDSLLDISLNGTLFSPPSRQHVQYLYKKVVDNYDLLLEKFHYYDVGNTGIIFSTSDTVRRFSL